MVKEYSCEKCGKTFNQKGHYNKHLQRKKPCDNIKDKFEKIIEKKVDVLIKEKIQDLVKKGDIEIKNKNFISNNPNINTEMEYINKKIPRPQYMGNKIKYINDIISIIPEDVSCILDAFSGCGIVSYELKKKYKIYTNDLLKCNHVIGKSLIENNNIVKITDSDIDKLFIDNPNKKSFITDNYTNLYYTKVECLFLDNLYSNIKSFNDEFKESILFTSICRTLIKKILFAYFTHTKAIYYRETEKHWKRNPAINRDMKQMFIDYIHEYNNCIFDNKKHNKSFNMDIFDLLKKSEISDVDLIYMDPPYGGTHNSYNSFYHFLETYINYWDNTKLYNKTKMPKDKLKKEVFVTKNINEIFDKLFDSAKQHT